MCMTRRVAPQQLAVFTAVSERGKYARQTPLPPTYLVIILQNQRVYLYTKKIFKPFGFSVTEGKAVVRQN